MSRISSLTLLKRFQPKFREVVWYPGDFVTESQPKVIGDRIIQNECLLLLPGFLQKKIPISPTGHTSRGQIYSVWWSDHGIGSGDPRPLFQIRDGNLSFSFIFNPRMDKCLKDQLRETVMRALYDGPFKGRKFFMDPMFKVHSPQSSVRAEFSIEGDSIPGLQLGSVIASDWKFFIPEGIEREIIQTAIDIEEKQEMQYAYHKEDPIRGDVRALQEKFEGLLQQSAIMV